MEKIDQVSNVRFPETDTRKKIRERNCRMEMMMRGRDLVDGENNLQVTEYIVVNIQLMMFSKSSLSTDKGPAYSHEGPPHPQDITLKMLFFSLDDDIVEYTSNYTQRTRFKAMCHRWDGRICDPLADSN